MSAPVTRRTALGLGAAAALAAGSGAAIAATSARRSFRILRSGKDIGRHTISLEREGDTVRAAVDVEIAVRVLGITAYRYTMKNRETWRGGRLVSIASDVNDDGRRKRVRAETVDGTLRVKSDFFDGPAPADAATTTYFTPDFLKRPTWISTDSGELYAMQVRELGAGKVRTARGEAAVTRWRARNGVDFDVELAYDARGEWASVAFDAGGERAVYVPDTLDDSLNGVWLG